MSDPFDLDRFVSAQAPVFDQVIAELRAGRKRSHWMWFVFPQLRGLGRSEMAWRYGVSGLDEARAYLAHPVLGPRLRECQRLVLAAPGAAEDILGPVDALKLRSCVTLFDVAAGGDPDHRAVLERWWDGAPDPRTTALLGDEDRSARWERAFRAAGVGRGDGTPVSEDHDRYLDESYRP